MELFGMSINEILLVSALILLVIDIFFVSDIPTHIAWVLVTVTLAKEINVPILYQILLGVVIWFALVVFHYTLWRKVIEKINDKFIAPTKHQTGIQHLMGQKGVITNIDGKLLLLINEELHPFKTDKQVHEGEIYVVQSSESNYLII